MAQRKRPFRSQRGDGQPVYHLSRKQLNAATPRLRLADRRSRPLDDQGAPHPEARLKDMRPAPALLLAAAVVLVLALGGGIAALAFARSDSDGAETDSESTATSTAQDEASAAEEATAVSVSIVGALASPSSTPSSAWTAGVMPHLYQIDPAWADLPYAGGTIAQTGCGPTCLAMVYIYLTGNTDMGVVEMCALADENGYAASGSTSWSFMTEGAAALGLASEALTRTRSSFIAALEAGQPIICNMQPGTFTDIGHYIVVAAIDDEGMCTVYDPNSSYRSAQLWPLQTILTECDMAWAYTVETDQTEAEESSGA